MNRLWAPAYKRAAARGAAKLVEYLDSTVPRAALESHLADTTWKAETAPGSGRRAALHLAIVNCDVAAVDALLRRDLIRQVILPDSDACIPLFYAALRGVRMLMATVRRLKVGEVRPYLVTRPFLHTLNWSSVHSRWELRPSRV